jgi:hypothetical protein
MKRLLYCMLALAVCCIVHTTAAAQPPLTLNYQGVLTDAGDSAVPDGVYGLTFRLYDVDTGGSELWSETRPVGVNKGIFNVVLGTDFPLELPFDRQYWLGISVEGEAELIPRIPLASSAYSMSTLGVRGYTNVFPAEGNVGVGTTTPSHPLHIAADQMTGLRFDGMLSASWANIILNAQGGASHPSYEYYRQGMYRGRTYLDNDNNWRLQLGGDRFVTVKSETGLVGIGTEDPAERLDVAGGIRLGGTDDMNAGTIRWTGADFEGYNGSSWQSLTTGGASLPPGSSGQTLRHNGSDWTASSALYNNGTNIGIGTTSPLEKIHIKENGPTYAYIEASSGYASGVMLGVGGTPEWSLLYHPVEGTIQMYKEGSGAKMVIGDGGRVGIGTTLLSGLEWLEVHNPNPDPGEAAITGYSYFTSSPTFGGGIAVAGIHTDDGVGGAGVYGEATDGDGMFDSQTGVYGYTDDGYGVYSDGTLGSTGPVVTLAATSDYGHRKVYAVQSTGNWFEDFGEGRLESGRATVRIDPVFAQTVNLEEQYHVFLTPLGDCGLYVAEKTREHFEVRARDGKSLEVAFDYRIVAKRRGYETKRLEAANDPAEMRARLRGTREIMMQH